MGKITAQDIANYFLSQVDEDCGDGLSNLKLQKLLYYAQGFHLAIYGTPLFDEAIERWTHGPVVRDLYFKYKKHESDSIPRPEEYPQLDEETKEFLDEIYSVFGQFSAWKLRNMTHEEPPWRNTPQNGQISHEDMKRYFETQIE